MEATKSYHCLRLGNSSNLLKQLTKFRGFPFTKDILLNRTKVDIYSFGLKFIFFTTDLIPRDGLPSNSGWFSFSVSGCFNFCNSDK